ncbi:MAG: pyridoxamine 5'-phosphate oxidase family protein, partial [Pseudomonadota bacterium]
MHTLQQTAPAFVEMAHQIVWCSVATVDEDNRPRSRVLHPLWQWDGEQLIGWIATGPTPLKRAHLEHSSFVSLNYCLSIGGASRPESR